MSIRTILIIYAVIILLAVIALLVVLRKKRAVQKSMGFTPKKRGNGRNRLYLLYTIYRNFPLVDKFFARLRRNVSTLYPADNLSINKKATSIMNLSIIVAIVGTVGSWAITGNDIYYGFLGTYLSIIIAISLSKKKLAEENRKLYVEMVESINKVNDLYASNNKDVVRALQDAVYEIPYTCSLHFQKIHDILVAPNMKYEMDKYRGTAPNPYMELFLAACSSVRSFGDKVDKKNDKKTIFQKNLDYISEDIENELLAIDERIDQFRGKTIFCIASLFAVKPLEIVMTHSIPKLEPYYSGFYGIISVTLVFLCSLVCYHNITVLRDGDMAEEKYNSLWNKLARNEVISNLANNIYDKRYSKYRKYAEWQSALGDYTGIKALIVKRIVFAILAFIITTALCISGTQLQKYRILHSFTGQFENAVAPDDEFRSYMEEVAEKEAAIYKSANYPKSELMIMIKKDTDITNDTYAEEIADVIIASYESYDKTYFKFYYIFLSLIAAAVAFYYPIYSLKRKQKFIELRQDEEVSRYQTIILLLMHQQGVRVETILEWLERFAYSFREQIADCYISYNYNKKKAINKMKYTTIFKPFHSICDSLLNVTNVGIESAFSRIESDRLYSKDKRKAQKIRTVKREAQIADRQALLPLYAAVFLKLIIPVGLYAKDMFTIISQYTS